MLLTENNITTLKSKISAPFLNILDNNDDIYIFGVKNLGIRLYNEFINAGYKIAGFVDNNSTVGEINGVSVVKPEELLNLKDDIVMVIASINYSYNIYSQLKNFGFKKIIPYPVLTLINKTFTSEPAYDGLFEDYLNNNSEYEKLYDYFEDSESIRVLDKLIEYRKTFNIEIYNDICEKNQYFEQFIPKERIFVDGGAYDGQTSLDYINFICGNYEKIYLFEPDKTIFEKTSEQFKNISNIVCSNYGLSDSEKVLKFDSRSDGGSLFAEYGADEVKCISLDKVIKEDRAFIKLDIEGSETEALNGAKRLIKNHSPLAICVYHRPCDLWQIPKLIKSMNPSYKFYLRHYSSCIFQTIIYAI